MGSKHGMRLLTAMFILVLLVTWFMVRYEKSADRPVEASLIGSWCLDQQGFRLVFSPDMSYSWFGKDSTFNGNGSGRSWITKDGADGREVVLKNFRKRPGLQGNEYSDLHMPIVESNGREALLFSTDPDTFLLKCK
jgi:hypothetical protein